MNNGIAFYVQDGGTDMYAVYQSTASDEVQEALTKDTEEAVRNQSVADLRSQGKAAPTHDEIVQHKNADETGTDQSQKHNGAEASDEKTSVRATTEMEILSKSEETRRKLISRFCDRSMLTPAELESLRKREREYQRKRRARLRGIKVLYSFLSIPCSVQVKGSLQPNCL